jgi:YgiT-type zinc finger domain-containing protein
MMCPICEKGKMSKKTVDVVRYGMFVGHFKADVCSHCHEQIFDSKAASAIQSRMKELGLFGAEKASVYKVGGNFAIALKTTLAKALGVTKASKPLIISQLKEKRLIIEIG